MAFTVAQGTDAKNPLPRPFGAYQLVRRLAVGGMAEVFVAKARGLGGFEKLVALKVIHPRLSEDDQFVKMLVDEAKLSVLLNHANIAQTFDLGCVEERYFIVMEYVEGADASRLLRKANQAGERLPIAACVFIMMEVLAGLEYAHTKTDPFGKPLSIVHRDVSPQNVLLSLAGEVKLADFGIAKAALRTSETEVGVIKGKYYYMSPEQAWADPMDHRSDVFSAGVVLYELLTGRMLYQDDNVPALLDKVRRARVAPPSRLREDIPPELDAVCLRALARRPDDRFPSAAAFAEALSQTLLRTDPSFGGSKLAKLMNDHFGGDTMRMSAPSFDDSRREAETAVAGLQVMRSQEFVPEPESVIFEIGPSTQPPAAPKSDDDETVVLHSAALLTSELPTPRPPRPPRGGRRIVEEIPSQVARRDLRGHEAPASEGEEEDDATSIYERPAELRAALEAAPVPITDLPTPPRGIRRPVLPSRSEERAESARSSAAQAASTPPRGIRHPALPSRPGERAAPSTPSRPRERAAPSTPSRSRERAAPGPSSVEIDPDFAQEAEELGRLERGERSTEESTMVDASGDTVRRVEEMLAMASPAGIRDDRGRYSSPPDLTAAAAATWEPPRATWEPLPFIGPPLPAGGLAALPLQSRPSRAATPKWVWAAVALGVVGAGSAVAAFLAG